MQEKDQNNEGTPTVKEVLATQTQENVGQDNSAQAVSDNPQVSMGEVDSDSVDSSASDNVIHLPGPGRTGPENLPVTVGMADFSHEEELPNEKVDELVHRVIANRESADKAALATGTMLLDEVFGGSLDAALSHNPKKHRSFARICDHPDMDVDSTTLSRWVKAANLVKTFERRGKKFKNLTCSHYIALLSLKQDDEQLCLAEKAEDKQYSVRRLVLEIEGENWRGPTTLLDRISSKLGNPRSLLLEESKYKLLSDRKKWVRLDSKSRKILIMRVSNAKLIAETYTKALDKFHALLKEIAAKETSEQV
ncbi:MAG: hypothetical protein ACLQPD_35420 [Desulfomonilaceae bacterium]